MEGGSEAEERRREIEASQGRAWRVREEPGGSGTGGPPAGRPFPHSAGPQPRSAGGPGTTVRGARGRGRSRPPAA